MQRTKCFQFDSRQTLVISMKGSGAIQQPPDFHCPANTPCDVAATHLFSSCAASSPAERVWCPAGSLRLRPVGWWGAWGSPAWTSAGSCSAATHAPTNKTSSRHSSDTRKYGRGDSSTQTTRPITSEGIKTHTPQNNKHTLSQIKSQNGFNPQKTNYN